MYVSYLNKFSTYNFYIGAMWSPITVFYKFRILRIYSNMYCFVGHCMSKDKSTGVLTVGNCLVKTVI